MKLYLSIIFLMILVFSCEDQTTKASNNKQTIVISNINDARNKAAFIFSQPSYQTCLNGAITSLIESPYTDERHLTGGAIRMIYPPESNSADNKLLVDSIHLFYINAEKRLEILKGLGWLYLGDGDTVNCDFSETNLIVNEKPVSFTECNLYFDQKDIFFVSPPTRDLKGYVFDGNRDRIILRVGKSKGTVPTNKHKH